MRMSCHFRARTKSLLEVQGLTKAAASAAEGEMEEMDIARGESMDKRASGFSSQGMDDFTITRSESASSVFNISSSIRSLTGTAIVGIAPINYADATELRTGFAWNLNNGVNFKSTAELADITQWSQREFSTRRDELSGRTDLTYMSEKLNGDHVCVAVLLAARGAKGGKVKEMASVTLTNLTAEVRMKVANGIYYYDRAFYNKDARYRTAAEYEAEVPNGLYPILITWKNDRKKVCCRVIAFDSKRDCQSWMITLKTAMGLKT